MIILSKNIDITLEDLTQKTIVYNLIKEGSLYSIECYIAGSNQDIPHNYGCTDSFSQSEEFANQVFDRIVCGKVFPIHIQDIIMNFFPCYSNCG
ncbi:MAG: DUF6514 family protein [Oscillospiraceae bacterium]